MALNAAAGAERKPTSRKPQRVSNQRKSNPIPAPGRHRMTRTQVVSDIEALIHEAKRQGARFEPSMDYLRRASAVLSLCKSREQCTAAIPLCHIVERSSTTHGKAEMECMRVFQKAGRNQKAVALADKLLGQDVFLLNPSLASAIQACAALGEVEKGFQFFDIAMARGSIPNLSVYSALLAVAGAAGDPQRVQDVLEQMKEAGVKMTDITFHNLMSAYAHGGHVTEALALFDKMQEEGIPADEHTYAILMDAHAVNGEFEGAQALMNELKESPTLTANLVHYNIMLKACGKVSNLSSAFELYEEMKERKIQPDLVTFITMMHAVYHGELGTIDAKKVKAALVGMGVMGAAFVPFINYQEYIVTTIFCGSLVGSMGLATYMNPDGVIRALYPNSDEPRDDTVIEAFFRRLREEDHCGRSMYLWREMLKFNVPADPRVYDVLVRTCVRKRHPELAYEAVFEEKLPIVDKEGAFVLGLPTTINLLHSLLSQRRTNMADTLYEAARTHNVFNKVFSEKDGVYVYDLRSFLSEQVRSYTIIKLLDELRAKVDSSKVVGERVKVKRGGHGQQWDSGELSCSPRLPNYHEVLCKCGHFSTLSGGDNELTNGGTAYSCFDGVYSGHATQQEIFESVGQPFVTDLLAGYNCTIIAYGQTGSGKTYTIVGEHTVETRGLVPRVMEAILEEMASIDPAEYDISLTASFVEVYQERLRDLLLPNCTRPLRLREDRDHDVRVEGASEIAISTVVSGMAILSRGNAHRSTGSTLMNADSSRSHSVLILTFTKKHIATGTKVKSRMCIVDLAGSEKVQKTAASGVRMEEAKHINRVMLYFLSLDLPSLFDDVNVSLCLL
ncbi:hypothetical protein BBJ29_004604 [Phytophthora kernoviae]|uniref:Kinesin-like protein n=1 Tax=Phytophthora kernoviae TaxID=325452 RepID=A0A3F2RJ91_9STRA|nr:hypothetical protein BBP00_00007056 [Phytophthora kernoviae]RLN70452.1 hypothetical protein BBJ29_004604 [Phytophthora kernoviae]